MVAYTVNDLKDATNKRKNELIGKHLNKKFIKCARINNI